MYGISTKKLFQNLFGMLATRANSEIFACKGWLLKQLLRTKGQNLPDRCFAATPRIFSGFVLWNWRLAPVHELPDLAPSAINVRSRHLAANGFASVED
jgi:hypothetical protein